VKVKYKQTVFGFLWAIIQPLFMAFLFTVFLGDSISQKTQLTISYPAFALSGMLLWGIFSGGMSNAANSMVNNANIIKKIYFPRLIIPISSVLVAFIDFMVAFLILIIFLVAYKIEVNYLQCLLIPISILITCMSAMGLGAFLAALNVKYRDVRYVIPFLIQGLLFLTPIMYPVNITANRFVQFLLQINPLSGALELMRGIFKGYTVNYETILISTCASFILFVIGIFYFRKTEGYFADLA
jgi:lipopolysaccharide transport system permease protein